VPGRRAGRDLTPVAADEPYPESRWNDDLVDEAPAGAGVETGRQRARSGGDGLAGRLRRFLDRRTDRPD
jgi:hypothetical protein